MNVSESGIWLHVCETKSLWVLQGFLRGDFVSQMPRKSLDVSRRVAHQVATDVPPMVNVKSSLRC